MKKLLNKKGFTLVELLAVIVVLGIVMLIATRSITTQMNKSKGKSLLTQAQALQREINNECLLNDEITVTAVENLAAADKIFKTGVVSVVPDSNNVRKGSVAIKLTNTSFSNVIVPAYDGDDIEFSKNSSPVAAGEKMTDGTVTIVYDCSQ